MNNWNKFKAKIKLYLTAPGNGVYTVHTAKDKKDRLFQKLFKSTDNVQQKWEQSLEQIHQYRTVVLELPTNNEGGIQRGANWGPLFLRDTLLDTKEDLKAFDIGDVRVIPHLLHDKYLNDQTIANCRKALYQNALTHLPVSPLSIAEDFATNFYRELRVLS